MSKKISLKTQTDLVRVVTYLEDVAKCLKDGRLCAQQGDEFVTLTPAKDVSFEMEASRKKDKESIELKIRWRIGGEIDDAPELLISTVEPEVPEEEVEEKKVEQKDTDAMKIKLDAPKPAKAEAKKAPKKAAKKSDTAAKKNEPAVK